MAEEGEVRSLGGLLDALAEAAEGQERVSVGDVHEEIGIRSFGPLLLAAGVVGMTPIAGVPGVPTALSAIVILIAGQLLIGLEAFWIPGFLRSRSVRSARMQKAVDFLRPVARVVDKLLQPRLTRLTARPGTHAIAALCLLVAAMMPPLELVPLAGTAPAAAITLLGLGLIARDGIVLLLAFALSGASLALATLAF